MLHAPGLSRSLAFALMLGWLASGCMPAAKVASSGGGSGGNGSGGSSAAGGSSATGGRTATGGSTARGGSGGSGGAAGSGGSSGTGGSSGSGGKGGAGGGGGSSTTSAGGSSGGAGGGGGSGGAGGTAGSSPSGGAGGGGGSGAGGTVAGDTGGGSGGGGGGTATDPNSAPTSITNLKVDANPKSVLSAFVSWTTDKPANSVVQFGEGKYQWEISDSALVTSHKVLIIGMHASKANQIKAMSSNGGATVSATTSYTSGALPSQLPAGTVPINDTTKTQPGWTLMNVQKGDGNSIPSSSYPAMSVMYDETGQPVWYYIDGTTSDYGGAISADLTDKGVLIGPVMNQSMATGESPREVDFAGNTLWQCPDANCGDSSASYLSHEAAKLSNGDYLVLRWITTNNNQNPIYEEYSPSGQKVWSLDYSKFVPMPSGASGDWCHGNAITIDIAKNVVYANCRWMGLIKTTYTNPTMQWFLPASYGKATGTMTFSPSTSQFSDTHDPEIHDDGTILFFDNGGYNAMSIFPGQPTTTTYHSRAVEYKIDENAKTATLVWEFPGSFTVDSWYKNNWYQPFWGDADRLANGNVLITAGNRGSGTESRVFEVTKADGKVVWELHLGPDMGIYRADRITPPLVKAISQ